MVEPSTPVPLGVFSAWVSAVWNQRVLLVFTYLMLVHQVLGDFRYKFCGCFSVPFLWLLLDSPYTYVGF